MRPPLLPAASISQRPLEAYLPGSETPSFFQEASIAGNGNCGFTLLGITSDEFVDALAPLAGDAEIRSSVWEEIHEALTTQVELWSGPTTEWKVFFSAILALDAQIQRSLVTLGAQYGLDHSLQLDEFIISLEELGHDADADRLRQLGLEVALQRAHFESYCKRQDVFLSYLETVPFFFWRCLFFVR